MYERISLRCEGTCSMSRAVKVLKTTKKLLTEYFFLFFFLQYYIFLTVFFENVAPLFLSVLFFNRRDKPIDINGDISLKITGSTISHHCSRFSGYLTDECNVG